MKRALPTGMSGVGKSTIATRLSELGYKSVDTDYGGFSVVDEGGRQHWDVDRIRELLATEDVDVLFVVGCDDSQVLFHEDFDDIVLLSAPRRGCRSYVTGLRRVVTATLNDAGLAG
jgi:broad-specificity NMP kinase